MASRDINKTDDGPDINTLALVVKLECGIILIYIVNEIKDNHVQITYKQQTAVINHELLSRCSK